MRTETWTPSHCELCGGLGAAVERRVVGDVMVDEAGHKWIAYVSETTIVCGESHHQGYSCMLGVRDDGTHYGNHRAWSAAEEDDQPWFFEWANNPRNLDVWRWTNCRDRLARPL